MADTTTTNYGLTKPAVNDPAGDSAWGPKLNNNFDIIDTNLKRVDNASGTGGSGAPSATIAVSSGSTTTAAAADKGKQYIVAGNGVLSLPSAVQVAGWYAYVRKNDKLLQSGTITPSSVNIDGLSSIKVYQEDFVIWWDSAASVFRTYGRAKGWLDAGVMNLAAAASNVLITTGFGDTEIQDVEAVVAATLAASDYPVLGQVQKNGTVQTGSYVNNSSYNGTNTSSASGLILTYDGQGTNHHFKMGVVGVNNNPSAATNSQRMYSEAFSPGQNRFCIGQGLTGTTGTISGINFVTANTVNFTTATIVNLRVLRA